MTADQSPRPPSLTWLKERLLLLGPARAAFILSILLSLIAIQKGTLNRDGMLYVETARIFLEDGFKAAAAVYFWPFLSILMAVVSKATGLGLEASGRLMSILFMAGACSLLVASASRIYPQARWHICLVLLAMPGFNEYRNELLREFGCWFFVALSLWLALRWSEAPNWTLALATQAVLVIAALFRPEALALLPALVLWQWFSSEREERRRRVAMIGSLPAVMLVLLLVLVLAGHFELGRLTADLQRLALKQFRNTAQAMSMALPEYGQEHAATILFFGSLAIVPLKFVGKLGLFAIPLFYSVVGQPLCAILRQTQVFIWVFFAHILVLSVFVLETQFLAGRYFGPLLLFAAPLAGNGLWLLTKRLPRLAVPMVVLSFLVMIGNVTSTQPAKLHFVEAGHWLMRNAEESPRIYIESGRAAYYAGWHYRAYRKPGAREQLKASLAKGEYDLVVLEVSRKEPDIESWLAGAGLIAIKRFDHPNRDAVIVAKPVAARGENPTERSSRSPGGKVE